ncbi:hypothetical protein UFOVP1244_104 [uncultured Caudovirales phage]|uniref:Uncharacterized protein n=1 Tax=uncultured Caudovirales phage TaxID=2100421 RepID=A0A6J5REU3_9CAUD|nr:hypothetical protein UFOVP1244_104 [uncultured Caudovirales phage]
MLGLELLAGLLIGHVIVVTINLLVMFIFDMCVALAELRRLVGRLCRWAMAHPFFCRWGGGLVSPCRARLARLSNARLVADCS